MLSPSASGAISETRRLQIFEECAVVVGAIRRRANEYAMQDRVEEELEMTRLEVGVNELATDVGGR